MKKLLLLALLLAGAAEESYPVAAAPVAVAGSPTRLERTRRRLHRQSAQRVRRYKRLLGFNA